MLINLNNILSIINYKHQILNFFHTKELQEGKSYRWCACGRSKDQPLCDNSHSNTGIKPIRFTAEKSETIYLCGCKRSSDKPFCDMTHEKI